MSVTLFSGVTRNGHRISDCIDSSKDMVVRPELKIRDKLPDETFVRITKEKSPEGISGRPMMCVFYDSEPFVPIWAEPLPGRYERYIDDYGAPNDIACVKIGKFLDRLARSGNLDNKIHDDKMWNS